MTDVSGTRATPALQVSIGVLAYNEEGALARVVGDLDRALAGYTHEIIIVDDGSTDGTASVGDDLAAAQPQVRVVRHTVNRGGGATTRTGLMAARGELVAIVPGDGQFVAADLPRFIEAAGRFDVVVSRRRNHPAGARRRLSSWCYRTVIRMVLGLRIRDLNWVKMYHRAHVQALPLTADSWLIDAEILYRLNRAGRSITEIDVTELPRTSGEATGASPLQMLTAARELVRFRRRLTQERPGRDGRVAQSRGGT